jgi:HTH-type transcriptional regulator/antitoxin HigA
VRIWLVEHEMTQEQLARRLDISPSHLSDILNEKERPSLDVAAAFEREVGIPARAFAEVA